MHSHIPERSTSLTLDVFLLASFVSILLLLDCCFSQPVFALLIIEVCSAAAGFPLHGKFPNYLGGNTGWKVSPDWNIF